MRLQVGASGGLGRKSQARVPGSQALLLGLPSPSAGVACISGWSLDVQRGCGSPRGSQVGFQPETLRSGAMEARRQDGGLGADCPRSCRRAGGEPPLCLSDSTTWLGSLGRWERRGPAWALGACPGACPFLFLCLSYLYLIRGDGTRTSLAAA